MTARRLLLVAGLVLLLGLGYRVLGNGRAAEGPPQGGVIAAGPAAAPAGAEPPKVPPLPVLAAVTERRTLEQTLRLSGTLLADEDVQIASRLPGKVMEVRYREGDRVERGAVLVRLDDREVRAQLARVEAQRSAAQARYSQARHGAGYKDATARAEYERAELAVEAARARVRQAETSLALIDTEARLRVETAQSGVRVATERLTIARELTRRQELRQAQLAVDQANAALEQARVDAENAQQVLERRRALFQQDAIAREEVDEAERRHKAQAAAERAARAGVTVAEQKLELAREGSRAEEVRIAEGQLRAAERNLEQAESDRRRRDVAASEVETARAALSQAEAALRAAAAGLVQDRLSQDDIAATAAAIRQAEADRSFYQAQLADLTIRAPVSGVLAARRVNVGEMVTAGAELMQLVALDSVYLEAQAPELDVVLLRPGAPAHVVVDALGQRPLPGTVREVIPVADRASRAFRVRIAVLGTRSLPANAFARAEIRVGTRRNVLAVAREAVFTEAGDNFVWTIAEMHGELRARRRTVRTGLADERHVEVLSGLREGDRVVASGSPAIMDGTLLEVGGNWPPTAEAAPRAPAVTPGAH
jgi:multidrug efflux pump subunit AcrA (membrane-fusion protein)